MAPSPAGTAACIALPRMRRRRAASASAKASAAASAEYSPSEWPATNDASAPSFLPPSLSMTRMTATLTAISAGCAFSVKRQGLHRPFGHELRQALAERVVDLLEHQPCRREGLGQGLAHADGLRSLAGKDERARHVSAPEMRGQS